MYGCRVIIFMLLGIHDNLELCLMVSLQGRSFVGFGHWRVLVRLIHKSSLIENPSKSELHSYYCTCLRDFTYHPWHIFTVKQCIFMFIFQISL
uniref:Pco105901 n=1 Tax=Arundo donax TaxID=35708 RepID=A0A0A9EMU5_ARUDO